MADRTPCHHDRRCSDTARSLAARPLLGATGGEDPDHAQYPDRRCLDLVRRSHTSGDGAWIGDGGARVTNAKVFDEPVYNYTRDFGYLFEEITIPIRFDDDRAQAEALLLEAARRHTEQFATLGEAESRELQRRYFMQEPNFRPRVYWRITDNWLELTVRFVGRDHGLRELKDAISRDILAGLDRAGIQIASATIEIVGAPSTQPSRRLG